MGKTPPPRIIFVDLLMATMDSIGAWSAAAGGREIGLAWRDAVTDRMIEAGRYVPYEDLVVDAARTLGLPDDAPLRLWDAWHGMEPWPDAAAMATIGVPFAFVTNCSTALAEIAVNRSHLQPAFTLSAEEAGWYKPRPEIYRIACERFATDAADARFVAGAAYDAAGASIAGIPAVLVERRPGSQSVPRDVLAVSTVDEALANL
jgi:2-haloalkanoic acid dehalogenase type II